MWSKRRYLLPSAFLAAALSWPGAGRADFDAGLAVYDLGDYAAAVAAWRPLAEAGDPEAQIALAELHEIGLGLPVDHGAAFRLYQKAAEAGHPVAQLNLGEFYLRGLGTDADPVAAYVWLSRAAAQGRVWARERRDALRETLSTEALAAAERQLAD